MTVDSTRGKRNDFSVSTPVAILSVTGTSGEISYTLDAGLRLEGETGTWAFIAGNRQRNVKPNESTDEDLTPSGERKLAALDVSVDDALGNTGDEASFVREHGAGRGLSFLRGGGGRMNTSPAASALSRSGQLN